jgi:hypothetical protein
MRKNELKTSESILQPSLLEQAQTTVNDAAKSQFKTKTAFENLGSLTR